MAKPKKSKIEPKDVVKITTAVEVDVKVDVQSEDKSIKEFLHPTKNIIKSKEFSKYQRDFLLALLPKPEYTLKEARMIVNSYFNKGGI